VVHGSASADDIGGGLRGEHSIEDEERNFKNRTLVLLPFKGCAPAEKKQKFRSPTLCVPQRMGHPNSKAKANADQIQVDG
jgi:hypothetical protein